MGILPVFIATVIGGLLGIIAGFVGGHTGMTIMRIMDVFYAFPSILLAVAISGALGGGIFNGMMSLTLVFIPPLCRVAETATSQVRNLDFVEAARATGRARLASSACTSSATCWGPHFDLLIQPGQRVDFDRVRSFFPWSRGDTAGTGLGADAEHIAPSDLHPARRLRFARGRHFGHLNFFNLVSDGLRSAMDVRM